MATAEESYHRAASLRLAGDLDGAVAHYRQALALAPQSAMAWNLLGTTLQSLGRFDEATDCLRRAVAIKPDLADAYRNLAVSGELAADEVARIAALAEAGDLPIEERSAAAFTLGKVLDDAGRFDEAFAAYERANAMYRAARAAAGDWFDGAALCQHVDDAIAAFTPEFFATLKGWGVPCEIPVFIVGMPRSGTSLVEQIAASHSRVFGAGELLDIGRLAKELGPSSGEAGLRWQKDAIERAAAVHLARLREIGRVAERVIDKLPDNVLHLGLIATLFPRARVIFCRRDPRDTALSCYFQKFSPGGLVFSYDLADCGRRHVEIDRLGAHWQRVLPLAMLEIEYEKLVADLAGESRRLISFLGLEWDPGCLEFNRSDRAVETCSMWQVRQPLYDRAVGRWRNYERHLGPLLHALSDTEQILAEQADRSVRARQGAIAAKLGTAAERYRAGDLDGAKALYHEVLEKAPQQPDALHYLGVIAGVRGHHDEAARLINQSIIISPNHPDVHFDLGIALCRLQRAGEGESAFRNVLTLDPDHPPALNNLGQMLLSGGRDAEALDCFRRLIGLQPDNADAHFHLATCLRRMGDVQGSSEALRQVVLLAPEFQPGWNDLGLTQLTLHNWNEAEACFRKVLGLDPGSSRARAQLAHVQQQRRLAARQ
jgi:tetratricopeptide (TPR) repeat protein